MMNCIAIDDEPAALDVISIHCEDVSFINLLATFTSPVDAFDFINKHEIDLIFLDINMPKLSGWQFWSMLSHKPMVIITTAYSEYAVKAFDFEAIDYLLKPIPFDRFMKAVLKAGRSKAKRANIAEKADSSDKLTSKQDHIFVKTGSSMNRVNFDELLYVMSDGNYVDFFTVLGKVTGRYTLGEVELLLPFGNFLRIHRRYIVNQKFIVGIKRDVINIGQNELPLGASYQKEFMERIRSVSN